MHPSIKFCTLPYNFAHFHKIPLLQIPRHSSFLSPHIYTTAQWPKLYADNMQPRNGISLQQKDSLHWHCLAGVSLNWGIPKRMDFMICYRTFTRARAPRDIIDSSEFSVHFREWIPIIIIRNSQVLRTTELHNAFQHVWFLGFCSNTCLPVLSEMPSAVICWFTLRPLEKHVTGSNGRIHHMGCRVGSKASQKISCVYIDIIECATKREGDFYYVRQYVNVEG